MALAYHEKYDQYGRPQPHLHALSEATLTNGDGDRVEFKVFKEQLADLRGTLDEAQGLFLDRHLPEVGWRELYHQRHLEWELERDRLEQERLGQEVETSLVVTGILEPAVKLPVLAHAEVLLPAVPPLDSARPSDVPPEDAWPMEMEWLLATKDEPDRTEDNRDPDGEEMGLDIDLDF
jgi:hypothetical protein